jgi:hypothetical protein
VITRHPLVLISRHHVVEAEEFDIRIDPQRDPRAVRPGHLGAASDRPRGEQGWLRLHSMGHEKHGVTVFGEGLRALSVRLLPRSTEQGEARKRLPAGIPVPVTHHRHRSPVWTGAAAVLRLFGRRSIAAFGPSGAG